MAEKTAKDENSNGNNGNNNHRHKHIKELDKFYSDMLQSHMQTKLHMDKKANWILGVAAVIMSISLTVFKEGLLFSNPGYIVIFLSSLTSFLISLIIFEPPEWMYTKKHNPNTLMYYKPLAKMPASEFAEKLKKIEHTDQIIEQYAYSVVSMVNRNILFKSRLVKVPTYILFFGILTGVILLLIL